jgi:ribosomal protein S12 methylthiotransferase
MLSAGIQEIILIAQDTGRYGTDLYGEPTLMKLLSEIDKIPGKFRYKLLYLYPDTINKDVIRHFSHLKKFIPYFDIPFQHISKNVLKKM